MSEMTERVADAWMDEWDRWVVRTNKLRNDGLIYEVCRFDDSGLAGSFSEIHPFADATTSAVALGEFRRTRAARAVLMAMLDPTRSMIEAGKFWSTAPDDFEQDSVFGNLDGVDSYRSMITEALK